MGSFLQKFVELYSFSMNICAFLYFLHRLIVTLANDCEVDEALRFSSKLYELFL